jgi:hypothetical protein
VQVDAIVFLVDSADPERFAEAKKELDSLLSEDYLGQVLHFCHSCIVLFIRAQFGAFWFWFWLLP